MARSSASFDVYTVLTAAAAASLLAAIIFVVIKGNSLYDTGPLDPSTSAANVLVLDQA